MMYMIYIIGHIHNLLNEIKKWTFPYNSNHMVFLLAGFPFLW